MSDDKFRLKRRQALGLIASSAALPALGKPAATPATPRRSATLKDPDLNNPVYPWALELSEAELRTLAALCDMIIPADSETPAASALGVPQYINEHVSAPYPQHKADLIEVRGGLTWLEGESLTRFRKAFSEIQPSQKAAICDELSQPNSPLPPHAVAFFSKIRNMTASGYFTTRQGMTWVGYIGNTPSVEFPPPPEATLKKLGLDNINQRFLKKT